MVVDILRNERSGQQAATQQQQQAPPAAQQKRFDETPYTTLGEDTQFEGTLRFKDGLKIEGRFNGDISSEGILIVGKTGQVTAEISVGSIIVEGKVTGNIVANELVELRSSAELRGDITASKLKIEEGVIFVGKSDVQPNNKSKGGSSSGGGSKAQQQQPSQQQQQSSKSGEKQQQQEEKKSGK